MKEDEPKQFRARSLIKDTDLRGPTTSIYACADLDDKGAPYHTDEEGKLLYPFLSVCSDTTDKSLKGVQKLAELTVDFRDIPRTGVPVKTGADGLAYYIYDYDIVVTHYSASTKYEMLFRGVKYGSVSTEHV